MTTSRHINIMEFTLQSLTRRIFRNAGIIFVFSIIIFIAGSILFLTYSFKREATLILKDSPELILQRMIGGRHALIPVDEARAISAMPGVGQIVPRYWGYYYDSAVKANYTVVAVSEAAPLTSTLVKGRLPRAAERGVVAVGRGISRERFIDQGSVVSLRAADGSYMDLTVVGVFETESELLTSDLLVAGPLDVRVLFGISDGLATDLNIYIANETEAPVIARKIREQFPDSRPILRSEILRTYDAVFGWRSGLILTLFAGALTAFLILAWDKASGLSAEERKEIGILKALGWETSDVLEMKFWEGFIISVTSFLLGIIGAYIHVFLFGASFFGPALKGWSVLYPQFKLVPIVNPYQLITLMTLTVIPYIAATIIPSWKAAITDPDEVMRG